MALNPPLDEKLAPYRLHGETFVMSRADIEFQFKVKGGKTYEGEGLAILTSIRIVCINKKKGAKFQAFELPIGLITEANFEQPVFGANYLGGKCNPLMNILPGLISFKIWFMCGGSGTFVSSFLNMFNSSKKNKKRMVDIQLVKTILGGKTKKVGYGDPNDPSTIYVVQPKVKKENPYASIPAYQGVNPFSDFIPPPAIMESNVINLQRGNASQQMHYPSHREGISQNDRAIQSVSGRNDKMIYPIYERDEHVRSNQVDNSQYPEDPELKKEKRMNVNNELLNDLNMYAKNDVLYGKPTPEKDGVVQIGNNEIKKKEGDDNFNPQYPREGQYKENESGYDKPYVSGSLNYNYPQEQNINTNRINSNNEHSNQNAFKNNGYSQVNRQLDEFHKKEGFIETSNGNVKYESEYPKEHKPVNEFVILGSNVIKGGNNGQQKIEKFEYSKDHSKMDDIATIGKNEEKRKNGQQKSTENFGYSQNHRKMDEFATQGNNEEDGKKDQQNIENFGYSQDHRKMDEFATQGNDEEEGKKDQQKNDENFGYSQEHRKMDEFATQGNNEEDGKKDQQKNVENFGYSQDHRKMDEFATQGNNEESVRKNQQKSTENFGYSQDHRKMDEFATQGNNEEGGNQGQQKDFKNLGYSQDHRKMDEFLSLYQTKKGSNCDMESLTKSNMEKLIQKEIKEISWESLDFSSFSENSLQIKNKNYYKHFKKLARISRKTYKQ